MSNKSVCYRVDGSPSTDLPCGFISKSMCCAEGWNCMSIGLCQKLDGTLYAQGTCTDPDYQNCLSFCNHSMLSCLLHQPSYEFQAYKSYPEGQFDGFTEVKHCEHNSNNWCCGGENRSDCCATNRTTSLEPYPLTVIGDTVATSISLAIKPTSGSSYISRTISSSSSILSFSSSIPSLSSNTAISLESTILGSSVIAPTSSATPEPGKQNHNSTTGTKVGVPLAVIIVLLAGFTSYILWKNHKQRQSSLKLQEEGADNSPSQRPKTHEHEGEILGELDTTHYELTQLDAPRHELHNDPLHELNTSPRYKLHNTALQQN